jgi:uncharacterized membrane protein YcaP (DUF421 family)
MDVVFRALFVFGFLWVVTRISGRATIGELSTFQMLIYVTMGDLVQQAVTAQDYSVTSAVLAVGTFTVLTVGLSWVNSRYRRARPVTHGVPVVIVQSGVPLLDRMRTEALSLDDLMAAARENGLDQFSDIRLAVLEANGRISFFTDSETSGASDEPSIG